MVMYCDHAGRVFERKEECDGRLMYLYVCHSCQDAFYSTQPPRRDEMKDPDFERFWMGDDDF